MKTADKYQALSTLGIGSLSAAEEQSCAEFVGAMYGKIVYLLIISELKSVIRLYMQRNYQY